MKRTLQHPLLHLAIGLISFLLLYFSVSFLNTTSTDLIDFNTSLNQKEKLAKKTITELIRNEKINDFSLTDNYSKLNKDKGISFFILEDDKVKYWTNRSIDFSSNF